MLRSYTAYRRAFDCSNASLESAGRTGATPMGVVATMGRAAAYADHRRLRRDGRRARVTIGARRRPIQKMPHLAGTVIHRDQHARGATSAPPSQPPKQRNFLRR